MGIDITSQGAVEAVMVDELTGERPERRQRIEGNMTGREIRLHGTPHDVNRLMEACRETLRAAEARGNFEEVYLVQVDPPHEEER